MGRETSSARQTPPKAGSAQRSLAAAPAQDDVAEILSRLERLERQLAALADPAPASAAKSPLRIFEVKAAVYRQFGVTAADLDGHSREAPIVRARRTAMYLARKLTGKSFVAVGRLFGDRDHTTVIQACRTIERLRSADAEFDRMLQGLAAQICPDVTPGGGHQSCHADERADGASTEPGGRVG
jgi:hypothetical protein